jgi:peptidoglycan-associated lipoprotein
MRCTIKMFLVLGLVGLAAVILAGCSDKKPKAAPEAAELAEVTDPEALGPVESLETEVSPTDDIMEGRTSGPMLPIYFDFDSARIEGDQVMRIEANADYIKSRPELKIRIEGNCDPRGTREYNLALGERRALSAKKYLENLGISPDRLYTVSWGEEKLLLFGHDEISWAQNRRDDFVIIK